MGALVGQMSGGIGAMPPGGPLESILGGGNNSFAHGYGLGAPGNFQGYQTGPGIQDPQGYDAQGGDLTQRGLGENYFGATAGSYVNPSMLEGYAANNLNKYAGGTPHGTNVQGENYDRFAGSKPNIADQPGLDKYYDRAVQRSTTDINNQLAARGMYGSSGGVGRLEDAVTDLRADQAKNEAQYALQKDAEQRQWEGLQGQLAQNTDQNSLANSANSLSWLSGLGGLAQGADSFGLNRIGQGQQAANAAQGLEQGRFQNLFNNEMGMGNTMGGLMGNAYGDMLGTDQDLMNASMGMGMGQASEALNQDYRTQEKIKDDASWAESMMGGAAGGGLLGGL